MSARKTREREYWWSSDRSEKYWIELLKTDMQGDRLFAPDTRTYRTIEAVNVGDLVLHWHSERYPGIKGRASGIYSVSRAIGRIRPSHDLWEGKISVEVPLSRKVPLREPILLPDLKEISDELNRNRVRLEAAIKPRPHFSPWQFPDTGLKPMTRYLTKLTTEDVELIVADHPHLATAMTRA